MATFDYALSITDGAGTVLLTSDPFDIREYHPRVGGLDEATVGETLDVRVDDGSVTANLAEVREINRLLRQARDAQTNRSLAKVYLNWKETASGTLYRSEIKDGRAEWDPNATKRAYWVDDTQFTNIYIERVNYWEGPEAQLALTNLNGTANTSGLTVYNHNSGGTCNYVDISGSVVTGDMPGATRLELTNNMAGSVNLSHVWIGQNVFTPSTFQHVIEGEAATYGGSAVAAADRSGGTIIRTTVTNTGETKIFAWALSDTQAEAAGGRLHRVAFSSDAMATWNVLRFRLKITYGAAVVWQSDLVQPDSAYAIRIRNLFTVRLPPWLGGQADLDGLSLELWGVATIDPYIFDIDFFQLTPTDGYREIHAVSYSVPHNKRIMDDGINDILYIDDGSGSDKAGILTGYGAPVQVWPGRDQRLYFLMHAAGIGTAESNRTLSVKLFYRPRRRSL